MIPRSNSCFLPTDLASSPSSDSQSLLGYVDLNPAGLISFVDHSSTLLYSLSILKERVHQAQSLVSTLLASPVNAHLQVEAEPAASMVFRVSNLVQEIHSVSSSLMFTFQQLSLDPNLGLRNPNRIQVQNAGDQSLVVGTSQANKPDNNSIFGSTDEHMKWFGAGLSYDQTTSNIIHPERFEPSRNPNPNPNPSHDAMIIEMDAADLLAKYTHYCQVCNKGFKRDANLRMHMRAHGDEYKSNASLTNPAKNNLNSSARRYSCPQDGCRWNRRHPKFQPLKSMICVKNHYKRSHCPKMYVCKRCNHKDFSVVSDLRTHEKHCGDLKWRCSCGTTFSRKDKLMGHVGLFAGHVPASFDI